MSERALPDLQPEEVARHVLAGLGTMIDGSLLKELRPLVGFVREMAHHIEAQSQHIADLEERVAALEDQAAEAQPRRRGC